MPPKWERVEWEEEGTILVPDVSLSGTPSRWKGITKLAVRWKLCILYPAELPQSKAWHSCSHRPAVFYLRSAFPLKWIFEILKAECFISHHSTPMPSSKTGFDVYLKWVGTLLSSFPGSDSLCETMIWPSLSHMRTPAAHEQRRCPSTTSSSSRITLMATRGYIVGERHVHILKSQKMSHSDLISKL